RAAGDRDVPARKHLCGLGGQARTFERLLVLLDGLVDVGDLGADDGPDRLGQLRVGDRRLSAQLVGLPRVAVRRHDDGSGLGVVAAGGAGDPTLTGRAEQVTGRARRVQVRGVVLPVPAVAQQNVVDAA